MKALLDVGVQWHEIRRASEVARRRFNVRHPFATKRFETDGQEIFHEVGGTFAGLVRGQGLLPGAEAFFKPLDYSLEGDAQRWWPIGRGRPIFIDPEYYLGAPVVANRCVPTRVIAPAFKANNENVGVVSEWLGVSVEEVTAAIEFERSLAA